jgi:hypothetical protein
MHVDRRTRSVLGESGLDTNGIEAIAAPVPESSPGPTAHDRVRFAPDRDAP